MELRFPVEKGILKESFLWQARYSIMLLRILAVGDVVSEAGLAYLERRLRRIQQEHNVDFCG